MSKLTDEEYLPLSTLPIETVVDLAAELDILAPENIDRRALLNTCITALVVHSRQHGLPFSKYDSEDLQALSSQDLQAIGRLQGLSGRVTVPAILRRGARVYRTYQSRRADHPIPLMLPMLLTAVARAARSG